MNGAIYIDDAGTPGCNPPSDFLPEDRKSFCAVIVPEKVSYEVNEAISILLNGIKEEFNAKELHCTEIYGGRGLWKGVSVQKRKQIFDFLDSILSGFALPVLFQTWSQGSARDHEQQLSKIQMKEKSWWNLNDTQHFSLLHLCFLVSKEINDYKQNHKGDFSSALTCFIDEGLVKANSKIQLPAWGDIFENQQLNFVKSEDCPGIQLADFAAFCIGRSQWILANQKEGVPISDAEQHILKIVTKINWRNTKLTSVNPMTFSREGYEFVLMRDRIEKKLSMKFKKK
jgi:hypothetical protein